MTEWVCRRETGDDHAVVEALYDQVFGPARRSLSSYRLRAGVPPIPELCLVVAGPGIAGAVRFWPIRLGAARRPGLLAGPVGVHPTRQGEGLGSLLLRHGLAEARGLPLPADAGEAGNWTRVVLVGDEPYYRRFGFRRDLACRLEFPSPTDPARVLAAELAAGALAGVSGPVAAWTVGPWRVGDARPPAREGRV